MIDKKAARLRRASQTRRKIRELAKVRLAVHRTNTHIYAQLRSVAAEALTPAATAPIATAAVAASGIAIRLVTAAILLRAIGDEGDPEMARRAGRAYRVGLRSPP